MSFAFIESALGQGVSMITDGLENRRVKELEKRIADLERLVGWVTGLLIDFVAVVIGIGAAIFVAGDYYRLSAVGWLCSPCVYGHDAGVKFHFSESCEMVFRWLIEPREYLGISLATA
jgi:hypothetical protein